MKKFLFILFIIIFLLKIQIIAINNQDTSTTEPKKTPLIAKETPKSFFSKINFEFSGYLSRSSYPDLILRANSVGAILKQYSDFYNIAYSQTGDVSDTYNAIPLNLSINYHLKNKIYLRLGVEYFKTINKFTQNHLVDWGQNLTEIISVDLDSNIQYYSPYIGAEYRFSKFAAYLEANITLLKHHYIENITFHGLNSNSTKTIINTTANPVGLKLGIKYSIKITKNLNAIAKLEYSYLNVSSFKGEKSVLRSDENNAINTEGIVYKYETNPYNSTWIPTWDLLNNPDNGELQNLEKMSMGLSGIRFIIGISF